MKKRTTIVSTFVLLGLFVGVYTLIAKKGKNRQHNTLELSNIEAIAYGDVYGAGLCYGSGSAICPWNNTNVWVAMENTK